MRHSESRSHKPRVREGFRRGPIEHHASLTEQYRSLCLIGNSLQVMGRPDAGRSRPVDDLSDQLTQVMGSDWVEPRGGFIEKQKGRIEDQESREGYPSLLSKAQGVTRTVHEMTDPQQLCLLHCAAIRAFDVRTSSQEAPADVFRHSTCDEVMLWVLGKKDHATVQAI